MSVKVRDAIRFGVNVLIACYLCNYISSVMIYYDMLAPGAQSEADWVSWQYPIFHPFESSTDFPGSWGYNIFPWINLVFTLYTLIFLFLYWRAGSRDSKKRIGSIYLFVGLIGYIPIYFYVISNFQITIDYPRYTWSAKPMLRSVFFFFPIFWLIVFRPRNNKVDE